MHTGSSNRVCRGDGTESLPGSFDRLIASIGSGLMIHDGDNDGDVNRAPLQSRTLVWVVIVVVF